MSKKASKQTMAALHAALAEAMRVILTDGVTATNDDGEVVKLTPGAPYLSVIRQFLKDNSVEGLPDDVADAVGATKSNLPKFSADVDEYGLVN